MRSVPVCVNKTALLRNKIIQAELSDNKKQNLLGFFFLGVCPIKFRFAGEKQLRISSCEEMSTIKENS